MYNTFIVSDTHFGHEKTCTVFKREDGSPLRSFRDADEMNAEMIKRWNAVVRPHDKVYHLGDVVINKKFLYILPLLNGKKRLIRGNHDIFRDDEYRQYFRELRAYHVMNGMILSHIPLHPESLGRFGTNIHGHTHGYRVKKMRGIDVKTGTILYSDENDVRYHCVCVEQTDFAPILLEDVYKRIEAEGGQVGFNPNAYGNGSAM